MSLSGQPVEFKTHVCLNCSPSSMKFGSVGVVVATPTGFQEFVGKPFVVCDCGLQFFNGRYFRYEMISSWVVRPLALGESVTIKGV